MAQIPVQSFDVLSTPYKILRVDNIPRSISLRDLVGKVEPSSRHIVGIARTADYTAKRLGHTIYFICTNTGDAEFLEQTFIQFVDDGRDAQRLTIVDSIVGRASLPDIEYVGRYERIPVAVYIKGLKRQKDPEGQTKYLKMLLPHFEANGTVTSIRLGYDPKKYSTTNDGFVTYLNQTGARAVGGDRMPIKHSIYGTTIEASLSLNVPLIVRMPDSHLLENGRAQWSEEIELVNQLMVLHQAPFVHPRNQDADKYSGDPGPVVMLTQPTVESSSFIPTPVASTSRDIDPPVPTKRPIKPPKSKPIPIPKKSKPKEITLDNLSTTAVHNKKGCTTKSFPVEFESDEEIGLHHNMNRTVINLSSTVSSTTQIESSSDSDDDRLVIDEDVILDDEAEASTSRGI